MTPCACSIQPCRAAPTSFSSPELRLDVEVLADRYEDLLALPPLEDDLFGGEEEAEDADEEASDDLPF